MLACAAPHRWHRCAPLSSASFSCRLYRRAPCWRSCSTTQAASRKKEGEVKEFLQQAGARSGRQTGGPICILQSGAWHRPDGACSAAEPPPSHRHTQTPPPTDTHLHTHTHNCTRPAALAAPQHQSWQRSSASAAAPVLLVLQPGRVKVLADHVHVQLPDGRYGVEAGAEAQAGAAPLHLAHLPPRHHLRGGEQERERPGRQVGGRSGSSDSGREASCPARRLGRHGCRRAAALLRVPPLPTAMPPHGPRLLTIMCSSSGTSAAVRSRGPSSRRSRATTSQCCRACSRDRAGRQARAAGLG